MTEQERDFKGIWIPKEIWLDERLNALEKIIFAEVDSLDQDERGCYASNKYIADFCQCSETRVSTAISKLIELGYLYTQSFDGRQRELKSRLSNFERQTFIKCKADFKNLKEINIDSNTVINTDIKKEIDKEKSGKPNPSRKKYGMYSNVLLTDEDYSKLQTEFPEDYEERIERLSEYKASSGKRYKNDLATIRSWARKDNGKQGNTQKTAKTSPYGEMKKGLNL